METPDSNYKTDALIAEDIDAYLDVHQHKTMLRFITCGSVDDGKSTLIGRLLFDSKKLYDDQLVALERDSKRVGHAGEKIDYALSKIKSKAPFKSKAFKWQIPQKRYFLFY